MRSLKTGRRKFLKTTGAAAAGWIILPSGIYGHGVSPSDKLRVASVGAGGQATSDINQVAKTDRVKIVALCDVDYKRAAGTFKKFPKARRFKDFRRMYDKMHKKFDAVIVATPDHTHAQAALPAIELGKHVYVEKPLAHNIREARMLTKAAAKYGVVTQMGNQGASGDEVRQIMEWINAEVIGHVQRVHCWTNRPIWPQGVPTPKEAHDVPSTLAWDLWLGPAKYRDYNPAFMPFKWRGWWDFGTGALGDMGCHIIDIPFQALKLGYPVSAEASVGQVYTSDFVEADFTESCPPCSKVHIQFPARGEMPPVELIWYDGGIKPPRPPELKDGESLGAWGGGVLFEGDKAKLMCGVYGANPTLLPTEMMNEITIEPTLPRIEGSHQKNWVDACIKGSTTTSPFSFAGPLTETVLMGNLAIRSHEIRVLKEGKKVGDWAPYDYPGRTKLLWDGDNMKVTNLDLANQFVAREYRRGWEI